jgi:hypothetical protein
VNLPRRLLERFGRWPFVCAWLAVIFALSAIPSELAASAPRWPVDKVAHFGEYAILAALTLAALTRGRNARPLRALAPALASTLAAVHGASDEFHQQFGRLRKIETGALTQQAASLARRRCAGATTQASARANARTERCNRCHRSGAEELMVRGTTSIIPLARSAR